ncbi:MAG: hypothetical protein SH850_07690 [Planctomycetaceae bacterium]|nr:hypothetical protein [Planctomycetaceae bacterium]
MPAWLSLIPGIVVLVVIAVATGGLWREIRRHRRELTQQRALLVKAAGLIDDAVCAHRGGALSPWDCVLSPLPEGCRAAPSPVSSAVVEYQLHRRCDDCGRDLVFWLWADGDQWGFVERP